jgi:hypothetical protein
MTQRIYGLLSLKQVADKLNRGYNLRLARGSAKSPRLVQTGWQYSVSEVDLENYLAARRQSAPLPLVGPNSKNAEKTKWKYDGTTNWNGPALTPSARFDRRRCRGLRRPVSGTKDLLSVG